MAIAPPTHLATYSGSFTLPKGWHLPCSSPLVRLRSLLPLDETQRAYHRLGLTKICIQAYPLKHSYHGRQCCINPDRVSPCYLPIICVKLYVVLSRRPSKPMLSLLGSTYLLKGRPDHCIHYNIKRCRGDRVSLCQPPPRAEGTSIIIP